MARVRQFELKAHLGNTVSTGVGGAGDDVDVLIGQRVRNVPQQPGSIEGNNLDGRPERGTYRVPVPLDVDEASRLPEGQRDRVGTVRTVDRYPPAASDEPEDGVPRYRGAALREPNEQVVEPLDVDTNLVRTRTVRTRFRHCRGEELVVLLGESTIEPLGNRSGRNVTLTDADEQRLDVLVVPLDGLGEQGVAIEIPADRQVEATKFLRD
ncbi:unannotated protein [freshwater metagenome]|uniref:Unannotated protein n=1 Tax=freshwater metagenome TaxID=449393 RepID=A0A6J7ECR0_9ZZZZ